MRVLISKKALTGVVLFTFSLLALPGAAADYVSFVADALDVPVTLVGTGASRDAVLALQP